MNTELLNNLKQLKKDLVLLSEERKVVLSHHKTFELTDDLEAKVEEMLVCLKEEKNES